MRSLLTERGMLMKVRDIMDLLAAGVLTSREDQLMVLELVTALADLLDGTVEREIKHLEKIEQLEGEVRKYKRLAGQRKN